MPPFLHRTVSIWRREEGASLLLVFLLAHLFLVSFLRAWFPNLAPASAAVFALLFVVGVLVVFRSAWAKAAGCVVAGAAIALELAHVVTGADPFAAWRTGSSCVMIAVFAAVTLVRVFAPGQVTTHRLVGAVSAYLLVGLAFALGFEWLEVARPGSFLAGHDPGEGAYPALLYFSFVTLTTVGYGDVLPLSQQARALANLESLIGVLYPAVLIGRLVSMHAAGSPSPPGEDR